MPMSLRETKHTRLFPERKEAGNRRAIIGNAFSSNGATDSIEFPSNLGMDDTSEKDGTVTFHFEST